MDVSANLQELRMQLMLSQLSLLVLMPVRLFLRLMKETRETKKVLAQLYPRQAAKRMQQAATIAKAELEFVKYVHGVESEEYLNMLIKMFI